GREVRGRLDCALRREQPVDALLLCRSPPLSGYSMVGFWLLFFMYPLNGTHHYIMSSLPMDAQKAAITASMFLGMDVALVVANLFMSLRGSANVVARDVPLRFVWTGVIFYVVVSLQVSTQAS